MKNKLTYEVKKLEKESIILTGNGSHPAWQDANLLESFSYPWREETPPKTTFKALWNESYFYFLFRATDEDIIKKTKPENIKEVIDSDRVEIFFKADDNMNPYYSLEIDAFARVLDTKGRYHRKIDFDWKWPEGELSLKSVIDVQGYFVEGAISLKSLRDLGMLSNNELQAGLYRGEYIYKNDNTTTTKWISWIKPDSEKPDFHIPSSFGLLKLME